MADDITVPFETGELIAGKYRMERVIGAGGMGIVLEATHLDLERKVAVKLIRPELSTDESLVERMLIEARAAAKIKSAHVGAVLDIGRLEDGSPYLVMEYLEGCDLSELLQREQRLPIAEAIDLVLQACEALAHAHKALIIHRDLKPENLFIVSAPDGTRELKVLDFGIAKQLEAPERRVLTNPATAVGSPQYMAPEQMEGSSVDARADVWALGAILYEVLGGKRAFPGDTVPEVCAHVLTRPPKPLREIEPSVPTALESVVNRCLQRDPRARFGSVGELGQALLPHGSARAQSTFRNVRALLSTSDAPLDKTEAAPTGVHQTPLSEGGTDSAVTVESSRATEALPTPAAGGARAWGIGALLLAFGALVVAAIAWARGDDEFPAPSGEASVASAVSDEPAIAAVPASVQALAISAEPVVAPAADPPPDPIGTNNPLTTPQVRPAPTQAQQASRPTQAAPAPRRPAKAKEHDVAPAKPLAPTPAASATARSPARDAWDPDSFGSRR